MRKKLRKISNSDLTDLSLNRGSLGIDYWNSLPWKAVDVSSLDLGSFDDSVFFGLEEIDGSSYVNKTNDSKASTNDRSKKETRKRKHREEEKKTDDVESRTITQSKLTTKTSNPENISNITLSMTSWNNIVLNAVLKEALVSLDFQTPTPIQANSIPLVISNESLDIVGIAETGSGKTLAFVIPILHAIITRWDECNQSKAPFAFILSPTRELAMQIATVIKDLSQALQKFQPWLKIRTATVVGGLSEEKQRRLLSTSKIPLHIVIATPGRLNEIFQDVTIEAFQDLSPVRYLVVDEADRMMEEGHFSELYRIFSRFRDHDEIVRRGEEVKVVLQQRQEGIPEKEEEDEEEEEGEYKVGEEKDEEEDAVDVDHDDEEVEEEAVVEAKKKGKDTTRRSNQRPLTPVPLKRQTLLFSATGLETKDTQRILQKSFLSKKQSKTLKLQGSVQGLATNCSLPVAIKELLSVVAIQPLIRVIDVTRTAKGEVTSSSSSSIKEKKKSEGTKEEEEGTEAQTSKTMIALPKHLLQWEIRVPTEDKDILTYYYLLKNEGKSLIFVNSIKTARRLDGLLRALQFHCRTIHGDLPQRQRIKALETFQSSPRGILVATDIAARGLDIPKISSVIHYDIARTPQVYVHRSGRTARANQSGKTVSLVTPDDHEFHQVITEYVTGKKQSTSTVIQPMQVESHLLPYLRDRVQLAKKIFTASFVLSHELKEKHWLEEQAEKTDLALDDYLYDDMYDQSSTKKRKDGDSAKHAVKGESAKHVQQKKQLQLLRKQLTQLLETPIPSLTKSGARAASGSVANSGNDWRKRKVGFFVYTPQ